MVSRQVVKSDRMGSNHLDAICLGHFLLVRLMLDCTESSPAEPNPTAQTMNYAALVLGGTWFFAAGYYFLPVWGGRYFFTQVDVTCPMLITVGQGQTTLSIILSRQDKLKPNKRSSRRKRGMSRRLIDRGNPR